MHARFKMGKDCTFCHTFSKGGSVVNLPDHAQCCECHTTEHVEPSIMDCGGCHARPAKEKHRPSKIEKFSHKDHKLDPASGKTLACKRCHFKVPRAKKVAKIQNPEMATCVECHQGEVAFGYQECLKCHGPETAKKTAPKGHAKQVQKGLKKSK